MPLQQVKSNRNSCMRLARRAIAFVVQIRDTMDGKWDSAPPSLKESVDRFESYAPCGSKPVCDADRSYRLLLSIKDWMCDLAKTNLFTRVIKKDRIQDKLTDFEIQLTDTVSLFQVCFVTLLKSVIITSLWYQNAVLVGLQHNMSHYFQASTSQETGLVRQVQDMHSQMMVGFKRGWRPQDEDGVSSKTLRVVPS